MSVELKRNMDRIDASVRELFVLVVEGLLSATDAFLASDRDLALTIMERDHRIDAIYEEVEALIQQTMLTAPLARDLRYLVSMLRIVPELERSGDLVEHIASRALRGLGDQLTPRLRGHIERMGEVGTDLWRMASAFYTDPSSGDFKRVNLRDDEMDELHAAVVSEVVEAELPLPVAMEMALVARFFERLGDHAVNITNRLRYVDSGENMAHKEEMR